MSTTTLLECDRCGRPAREDQAAHENWTMLSMKRWQFKADELDQRDLCSKCTDALRTFLDPRTPR